MGTFEKLWAPRNLVMLKAGPDPEKKFGHPSCDDKSDATLQQMVLVPEWGGSKIYQVHAKTQPQYKLECMPATSYVYTIVALITLDNPTDILAVRQEESKYRTLVEIDNVNNNKSRNFFVTMWRCSKYQQRTAGVLVLKTSQRVPRAG
ncbi:hypothetical protein GQR58_013181 [Nymphon striatum]|nr:hypothetical protein GQR58_013181 [Nymphon striatum]